MLGRGITISVSNKQALPTDRWAIWFSKALGRISKGAEARMYEQRSHFG